MVKLTKRAFFFEVLMFFELVLVFYPTWSHALFAAYRFVRMRQKNIDYIPANVQICVEEIIYA